MDTHPSLFFSTSKSCVYAPLLVSNEVVCGVLSGMVVRLIEAFDGDARAGFSQASYRKGTRCRVDRVGESSSLMMAFCRSVRVHRSKKQHELTRSERTKRTLDF